MAVPALLLGAIGVAPAAAAAPDGFDAARGQRNQPRVVGGTAVPNYKYRFQAGLLAEPWGDDDWQRQYCGGSLIGTWYVLTAAHCVEFVGDGPDDELAMEDLSIVVGRTVLHWGNGVRVGVQAIAITPIGIPRRTASTPR